MTTQEIKKLELAASKSLQVNDYRNELFKIMATRGCNHHEVKRYVKSLNEDSVISLLTTLRSYSN